MSTVPPRLSIFDMPSEEAPSLVENEVVEDRNLLTKKEIQEIVPSNLRSSVTDSLVNKLNQISLNPEEGASIRENFLTYTHVLKEGKYKLEQYLDAAAYVTYKLMNMSNKEAYFRTFPDRIARLRAEKRDDREISSYISAYNKNKLVNAIREQVMIAPWVLNQDVYQEAIRVQADLMMTAQSEKVRTSAADSLLNHLKPPEASKVSITVGAHESDSMKELKDLLSNLAGQQRDMIKSGNSTKSIAQQKLFSKDKDVEDAEVTYDK